MESFNVRFLPGQDLKREIEDLVKKEGWRAACVLTGIRSLNRAVVRFAGREKGEVLEGPLEVLSLSGTLSPDGSHLHLSLSDGEGRVRGGHLMEGSLIYTTAEIVIGVLPEWDFSREVDSETGFAELRAKKIGEEE